MVVKAELLGRLCGKLFHGETEIKDAISGRIIANLYAVREA
jgi:hypothetical protein